jgi:hypothetical protein
MQMCGGYLISHNPYRESYYDSCRSSIPATLAPQQPAWAFCFHTGTFSAIESRTFCPAPDGHRAWPGIRARRFRHSSRRSAAAGVSPHPSAWLQSPFSGYQRYIHSAPNHHKHTTMQSLLVLTSQPLRPMYTLKECDHLSVPSPPNISKTCNYAEFSAYPPKTAYYADDALSFAARTIRHTFVLVRTRNCTPLKASAVDVCDLNPQRDVGWLHTALSTASAK